MPVRIPAKRPQVGPDPLEDFWDNMVDALMDVPIRILIGIIGIVPVFGQPIANALGEWLLDTNEKAVDAIETAVSVGTQVNYMQHIIAVRTGRPVWETGPDRTACVSFPFGLMNLSMSTISIGGGAHSVDITGNTGYADGPDNHRHSGSTLNASAPNHVHTVTLSTNPPAVNATATYAPWGTVIFDSAAERKVVNWIAWKSGTVSTFFIDIYKLEADGSSTYTGYTTPDLAGALATMPAWMSHLMSNASIVADIDDAFEAQFRMTGTGTVHIGGVNLPYPTPLPGFRPYAPGSGRNAQTTPTPATISTATRDAMYTGPAPFIGFGIDVGQVDLPRFFFDDFNRSSLGARWIRFGDIGIDDNKVEFTGSPIANASAAAMYHQPLATELVEVGFDATIDEEDVGVGVHCPSNLGNGVWLTADVGGVRIQTGAYNSRTDRATATVLGSGRYTLRVIASEDSTHYVYQAYFGDPNATDPVLTWPDTTNSIPSGIGRRWWAVMARRNGLIYPSGRLDNVTAADITIEEEET